MDRAKQNNEAAVHSALLENLSDDAIASLASSVKYSEIRQNLYNSVDTVSTVQYTELVTEKLFITPFQLQLNLDIINLGTIIPEEFATVPCSLDRWGGILYTQCALYTQRAKSADPSEPLMDTLLLSAGSRLFTRVVMTNIFYSWHLAKFAKILANEFVYNSTLVFREISEYLFRRNATIGKGFRYDHFGLDIYA